MATYPNQAESHRSLDCRTPLVCRRRWHRIELLELEIVNRSGGTTVCHRVISNSARRICLASEEC